MSISPDFDPEYGSAAEWAREYRRLGLQVVPCYAPSEVVKGRPWKRPRFREWTEFQETLVADVVFDRWYGARGEYVSRNNMGVIAGRASDNLFVIDLDTHKNRAALDWWLGVLAVHNNSMEVETAEQRTGGGGVQKLFRAPAGWQCPTNRTPLGVDIRGQGGFAVLAPSLHESGRSYEWLPGRAPWDDTGIARAPQWLLDEVAKLVATHGGDTTNPHSKSRTASPGGDFDGFGHQHDGREWKMRDLIWGAVVDWYRECPIKPGEAAQRAKATEKYLIYESLVISRLSDPAKTKTQLLEQEGRGPTEFWTKWQAAMKHWEGKVCEEAAKPGPKPEGPKYRDYSDEFAKRPRRGAEQQAKADPTKLSRLAALDIDQIKNMPDPVWLVEKMVIEQALGFIYGRPGCLKTFIALDLALSYATGRAQWWDRAVQRGGAVIYICNEGYGERQISHRGVGATPQNHNQRRHDAVLPHQTIHQFHEAGRHRRSAGHGGGHCRQGQCAYRGGVCGYGVKSAARRKENPQEDMTLFVDACGAVRERFNVSLRKRDRDQSIVVAGHDFEPYRTLVGHFRHEVGHYFWDRLVRDGGKLEACRNVFGDDRMDYEQALQSYYSNGAPVDWPQHFVTAYATAHPWEDFAETWAHYLHIVDTLEMAGAFGVRIHPHLDQVGDLNANVNFDPYLVQNIDELIDNWLPLSIALNSLNRTMDCPTFTLLFCRPAQSKNCVMPMISFSRRKWTAEVTYC